MTDRVVARFHGAMLDVYRRAKREAGYVPSRFLQLVDDLGGVEAARRLLRQQPSDGFVTLWEKGRLDLSAEFHILLPEFEELFDDEERRIARDRLEQFEFDVDRVLADVEGRAD